MKEEQTLFTIYLKDPLSHHSNRYKYLYFTFEVTFDFVATVSSSNPFFFFKLLQDCKCSQWFKDSYSLGFSYCKSIQKGNNSTLDYLFLGRMGVLSTLFFLTNAKTCILISLVFKEYRMGLMQGGMQESSDKHSTRWSGSKDRTWRPIKKTVKMGA